MTASKFDLKLYANSNERSQVFARILIHLHVQRNKS